MKRWMIAICVLVLTMIITGCQCRHEWNSATCTEAKRCRFCGQREGEPLGHQYENAGCEAPMTCGRCGQTQGEPLDHDWQNATCTQPKFCALCEKTEGEPLTHDWKEATCARPEWCALCKETRGEALPHTWIEATCEVPKYCSECAAVMSGPLGHSWLEATCDSPKTCSICAVTEGDALKHLWSKATCTKPQTCLLCGLRGEPALGHSWLEADCENPIRCSYCDVTQGKPLGHQWKPATPERPQTCEVCAATQGLPVELDDRFDVEKCRPFYGSWQFVRINTPEEVGVPGFNRDLIELITYKFGDYGALDKLTEIEDSECYKELLIADMIAELYERLAAQGYEGAAADEYMMQEFRMTVSEHVLAQIEQTDWQADMNYQEQLVYYVTDGMLYLSEYWEDPFTAYAYAMDGDRLILTEEGTGETIELTRIV